MLSVGRLRVLREVAYRGSFSAAAEALSYTQSAISQQIATLESETGMTLLERHPRGVSLTAAGQTLVAHAEDILARLDAAEGALAAITGLRGGRLRMGSFPTGGSTLMPLAIARFRELYPDVELTLAEAEPEEIVPRLRSGELDLALVFQFDGEPALEPGMIRVPLLEDPMYLVLPAEHRLARRRRPRLEDLRDQAWVQTSRGSACARHVVSCCRRAGFEPQVSFESDDYGTVQGLVAAGVGVALMPALALSNMRDGLVVRSLFPASPAREVVAAAPGGARLQPAVPAMLGILEEAAPELKLQPELKPRPS
jgi:DNA-binding transcriptional LysR family regulator